MAQAHQRRASCVLLALAFAACGIDTAEDETLETPIDELTEAVTATSCPTGAPREVCSGTGLVWTSLHRSGRSASALSETAQTFVPTISGQPESVRLKLRLLRSITASTSPELVVAIRPLSGSVVPADASSDLWRATVSARLLSRTQPSDSVLAFTSTTPLAPVNLAKGTTYALVFSTTEPTDPETGVGYVGVASHQSDTYPDGRVWRRTAQLSGAASAAFIESVDDADLSFALLMANCGDGLQNQDETSVDAGGVCGPFPAGDACLAHTNCASGYCRDDVCSHAASCKELQTAGFGTSQVHTLDVDGSGAGTPVAAYCDMTTAGGGWTVFDPARVGSLAFNPQAYRTDRTRVLAYLRRNDGAQFTTLLEQLPTYASHDLQVSQQADRFTLTFVPPHLVGQGVQNGLRSNGVNLSFTNCDTNPNSYFIFPKAGVSVGASFEYALSKQWRDTKIASQVVLPSDYFGNHMMGFGGCGASTNNSQWTGDGLVSAALGLR